MAANHTQFFVFAAVLQHHWCKLDDKGRQDTIQDLINRFGADTVKETLPYMSAKPDFADIVSALETALQSTL